MLPKRKGDCYLCGKTDVVIAKKLYDGSLCITCNKKRLEGKKEKKEPVGLNGEMGMFLKIWGERPHVSEVSGEPLGNILKPIFFSHLLGKGAFPKYRLNPDNIMLKTAQEHYDWQFTSRVDLVARDPRWEQVIVKFEHLKQKYFEEYGN